MKSSQTRLAGAVLATAVAFAFLAGPAAATDPSKGDAGKGAVKCIGGNSCKGHSECASAGSSCAGQNSCTGKGFVMASSEQACKDAGGTPEKQTAPAQKM